ncbi:MAG: PRC-barrel domain-containing protein, partial [Betaproteobacteria bacterium]
MLQKVHDINGDAIVARDGEIGSVKDVYFDDERWAVRYLVVDTGKWLPGKEVLISPASVTAADADAGTIAVNLTREQVRQAPASEERPPASRLYEEAHARYYGYPYYWYGPYLWGPVMMPGVPPGTGRLPLEREYKERAQQASRRAEQSHLRSGDELAGYYISAADGEIGHVEDFIVDDKTWAVTDMVVDTRNWLPGRKVTIPPGAIQHVDW